MKSTKIICTLGPACKDLETMKEMLEKGMDVARLNFSHGTHAQHDETIDVFRSACRKAGRIAAVMLDTKGPEIRLGAFSGDKVSLDKGQTFTLYPDLGKIGTKEGAGISFPKLADQVEKGTRLLIDDGKIRMDVEDVVDGNVICSVVDGGDVSTKKRINVPDVHLDMEFLSDEDRKDLRFGVEKDVDFIAASYVRNSKDVEEMRAFLDSIGGQSIKIISKIENTEGVENLEEILKISDGIMVARGDMGVEVDFAKLPGIQKTCIERCNIEGKPVITATQMLESMIKDPTPTRAEITDVANAVFDGTSAVMLSAETAAGSHPVTSVEVMSRILVQAEKDLRSFQRRTVEEMYEKTLGTGSADKSTAMGHAACKAAQDIGAGALIAITQSGYTAEMMSRFRPSQIIIGATPQEKTARQLALIHNIYPLLTGPAEDLDHLIQDAVGASEERGLVQKGDTLIISAGLPLNVPGNTNFIKVETVR